MDRDPAIVQRQRVKRTERGIAIAPAEVTDVSALVALERRCFRAGDRFSPKVWRHLCGIAERRRTAITLLARRGDIVVGAIVGLLRASSSVIRIYSIAVDPDARGLGLGSRLMGELLRKAPKRCQTVSLEVRRNNPARKLYERMGMQVVAVVPHYYTDDAAAMRYRAPIADVIVATGGH